MNGTREMWKKRSGKQLKIYQDSKQHRGKSVQQITRKIENEINLFRCEGFNQNLWNSGSETRLFYCIFWP